MAMITIEDGALAFGHHPLLDKVNFKLEKTDKYGLIGRNGTGKSSFLRVLSGDESLDNGKIYFHNGVKIAYVPQEPKLDPENTIFAEIMNSLGELTQALTQYYSLLDVLATDSNNDTLDQVSQLQEYLEHNNGWVIKNSIDQALSFLGLDGHRLIKGLSGGLRKKVALAKALVMNPDVVLLDEPTNHLDIYTIEWLEEAIINFKGAIVLVTHDRRFLDNTVDMIIELDRGNLRIYPEKYNKYQEIKQKELADEEKANAQFDKFLAQEEVWIRKGIECRRTRNEGRVRRLEELRRIRKERHNTLGTVQLQIENTGQSGKIVTEIEQLNISFENQLVINNFSGKVLRGDKVGLIGVNGAGKSTLLKAILGQIEPTSGSVKLGTKLEIAYFDQLREQLDDKATIQDVISNGQEYVFINGVQKHIATYLEEFLFEPARFRSPVSSLSGGERNRLLLARLFSQPANVLVMDEPTNDLDIDTLELLEELLANFSGTVFLISHDREFLDNVVTYSWVFQTNGLIIECNGGYSDWYNYKKQYLNTPTLNDSDQTLQKTDNNFIYTNTKSRNKLSYKEKIEFEELPAIIATLENEQKELQEKLRDPEIYKDDFELINIHNNRLAQLEVLIMEKLIRWETLDNKTL